MAPFTLPPCIYPPPSSDPLTGGPRGWMIAFVCGNARSPPFRVLPHFMLQVKPPLTFAAQTVPPGCHTRPIHVVFFFCVQIHRTLVKVMVPPTGLYKSRRFIRPSPPELCFNPLHQASWGQVVAWRARRRLSRFPGCHCGTFLDRATSRDGFLQERPLGLVRD